MPNSQSSRLAIGAPRSGIYATYHAAGTLGHNESPWEERIMTTGKATGKTLGSLGMPWERAYGYAQAVQAGNVIYVSGQLSHDDEGKFVAAAPVDENGKITDASNMEAQMRTTYANAAKLLSQFGATLDDVVEETIYVTDMEAAFAVAGPVRKAAYGTETPACASTIAAITRLAFPQQLVEISFTAVVSR
jgi:enamine deaminase RidA (YjgF/YER057c/UK114 family)